MSGFTVTYNGITDRSIGIHCKKRPSIPVAEAKVETVDLSGTDGAYYSYDGTRHDITIDIVFSLSSSDHSSVIPTEGNWMALYRRVKAWLLDQNGVGNTLEFSDDYDIVGNQREYYYYKVKTVSVNNDRLSRIFGEVTASFVCDGYSYRKDGDVELPLITAYSTATEGSSTVYYQEGDGAAVVNDLALSHPLYRITGSGTITLEVNGKDFVVTVNGEAYIDSEKMITYNSEGERVNITAQGDYEDLWLLPGENIISASYRSSTPMAVAITPRWRCL